MIHDTAKTAAAASSVTAPRRQRRLTLISFGFKYGQPNANYYFDVSFLTNPARQAEWDLFSQPCPKMRRFVLDQPAAQKFIEAVIPLLRVVMDADDDVRVGIGCSSGRHRSCIIVEELKRRLEDELTQVRIEHREEAYA
ncbi:MAG: hypothetical protein GC162_10920 [Planctomycetes bacterium]|nr:hypothetical protein [Planctomycetota bacterium]